MAKDTNQRGKASTYDETRADEICNKLALGTPLAEICRAEGMPCRQTVHNWMAENEAFAGRIARAREDGYEAIAADCLKIADGTEHDTIATESGDRPNTEWISRSKLKIETRLKLLSKWYPAKYGDKIDVNANHSGEIVVVIGGRAE